MAGYTGTFEGIAEGVELRASATQEQIIELFEEMRLPLLRYLSSFPLAMHDAEDVLQDAFVSLFQTVRRGKPIHSLSGWLFRAVHHGALKRRERCRADLEKRAPLEDLRSDALTPEDQVAAARMQERLQAVVAALPDQHRWCLYLRAEGLRYREIAEILNMSLGSVCSSLQRSLALMARVAER